jgi:23S rRNA pseudouridine1911/1915/1917 synthase
LRLDLLLIQRHPKLSRRRARDVIEKGQVDVNGVTHSEPGSDVPETSTIAWDENRKARVRVRSPLPLLYEDERLLIVDKPAGLLSVPSAPGLAEDCVTARMAEYAERLRTRHPFIAAAHRLDRDTSGALALALDPHMRATLRDLFRAHAIDRRYQALVAGEPHSDSGAIDAPIRDAYRDGRRGIAKPGEEGKPARTLYRVMERFGTASLIELKLETGRQHQIRIHLAHLGHPVIGDATYGQPSTAARRIGRQMLHAAFLGFRHPDSRQPISAKSPLPADFEAALRRLRANRPRAPRGPRPITPTRRR